MISILGITLIVIIIIKTPFKMRFASFLTALTALTAVTVQAVNLNDGALPDETVFA